MKEDREIRDLAPLDPRADPRRWEAMVQGINLAAAAEIARRSATGDPGVVFFLSRWGRPAAAFCGAIAAGGAAVLLLLPSSRRVDDGGLASALGYPEAVAEWVVAEVPPSVEELLVVTEMLE